MPKPRKASSYKLADDAKQLLEDLSVHLDLTMTQILSQAIREYARKHLPRQPPGEPKKNAESV